MFKTDKEIFAAVEAAYKQKYPGLTKYSGQRIIKNVLGGSFVLSKYIRTSKDHIDEHDELCFMPDSIRSLTPELFSSDEGLAIAMERQAERQSARERRRQSQIALLEMLFSRHIIAGFIFVIVMFSLIAAMFLTPRNPDVLAIMGSIAGAAAALYFASPPVPPAPNPTVQDPQIPPEI